MIRRILLLAITLAVLLVAFGAYHFLAGAGDEQDEAVPIEELVGPVSGPTSAEAEAPFYVTRDDQGRLRGIYEAESWEKVDQDTYALEAPRIELHQPDGTKVLIRGKEGMIIAQEVAGKLEVRKGSLTGDVQITYDRATVPTPIPAEQRPEELVRIYLDEVHFDNDGLMVYSSSPVRFFSKEMDLFGRGLTIRWNQRPKELRLLRIEQGEKMVLHGITQEQGLIVLPGQEPGTAASPAGARARATHRKTAEAAPARPSGAKPETQAEGTDSTARNIYRATFKKDVSVDHGPRQLRGAEELALTFHWDPSWRRSDSLSGESSSAKRGETPTILPIAEAPTEQPEAGAQVQAPPEETPRSAEAPADADEESAEESMVITWSGPLVIAPVGHTPQPSRDYYEVTGSGENVRLSDGEATADCMKFQFVRPDQRGWLAGSAAKPVKLMVEDGQELVCELIRFDLAGGTARLEGPGYMGRQVLDEEEGALAGPGTADLTEKLTWGESGLLLLSEDEGPVAEGGPPARWVRKAIFNTDVEMTQSGAEDYLKCQRLEVNLARGLEGAYPTLVIATGGAKARQSGDDIEAEKITLTFEQSEDETGESRLVARSLLADGDVRLSGQEDGKAWSATAEKLRADREAGQAILLGAPAEPARLISETNGLSGPEIHLDENEQLVEVRGPGRMHFRQDGPAEDEPAAGQREVEIIWFDRMQYSGRRNTAEFHGQVSLTRGLETMSSEQMRVVFKEQPSTEMASEGQEPQPRGDRDVLGFGQGSLSPGKLGMVFLKGSSRRVVLRSRRLDEQGQLVGRLELMCEDLAYNAELKDMKVIGPGNLVVEDYHSPESNRSAGQDLTDGVKSPSQTVFEWQESMQLLGQERSVVMKQDVHMVHRSGDKIVASEAELALLNVPAWPRPLPTGRESDLWCDNLLVRFAPPPPPEQGEVQPDDMTDVEGIAERVGPLDLFTGRGTVSLEDGPWLVQGHELIYENQDGQDVFVVLGRPDAAVTYRNPSREGDTVTRGRKLVWNRTTGRVSAERVTGAGQLMGKPAE